MSYIFTDADGNETGFDTDFEFGDLLFAAWASPDIPKDQTWDRIKFVLKSFNAGMRNATTGGIGWRENTEAGR